EGRGRGLVARPDHGHQLVAKLLVAHRAPIVVPGFQEQREDIVVLGAARLCATRGDLLIDELVEPGAGALEARPGAEAAEVSSQPGSLCDQVGPTGELADEHGRARESFVVADAEYSPQDHSQRDPLGVRTQGKWLAERPALHVPLGDLADQVAVAGHALSVKGRQQKFALAEVLGLVERQHRTWTERRLE